MKYHFCFDEGTIIKLQDGNEKRISEIKIGDILLDNSTVTTWMELSIYGQDIYNLNDVIVTGSHRVLHEEKGFIEVRDHENSFQINDYRSSTTYCLNTDSKKIIIKGMIFTDWDDLDEMDIISLLTICNKDLSIKFTKPDIHKYLNCGFTQNALIELEYGKAISIKDVEVNDILRFGERVLGKIILDATNIHHIKTCSFDGKIIQGSSNLQTSDNDLGNIYLFDLDGDFVKHKKYLYHLITDTGKFSVNGIYFKDYYNSGLENFMENENLDFLFSDL
jgi:hypothetical protein